MIPINNSPRIKEIERKYGQDLKTLFYKWHWENFFKKWTSEMAYVLGFFAADGNLSINSQGGCYIEFNSCDKELIENIKNLLSLNQKISERKRKENWSIAYRIQIGSKEMFSDLVNLGMNMRKSLTLEFPNIPDEFIGDFIRGYFDGDGCISFGKYWRKNRNKWQDILFVRFISGSKNFLKSLLKNLSDKKLVIGGSIHKKNRGYCLLFSKYDSIALYRLMYNNVSSNLYLNRKYKIFKKAVNILGA